MLEKPDNALQKTQQQQKQEENDEDEQQEDKEDEDKDEQEDKEEENRLQKRRPSRLEGKIEAHRAPSALYELLSQNSSSLPPSYRQVDR